MNVMLQRFQGTLSHEVARALLAVLTVPRSPRWIGKRGRYNLTKKDCGRRGRKRGMRKPNYERHVDWMAQTL